MNKFYDLVGFARRIETTPDVWRDEYIERNYYGDILKDSRTYKSTESLNDNFLVTNTLSIIADDYAYDHLYEIKYIRYRGVLWNIVSINIERPRIILTMGGVYNAKA